MHKYEQSVKKELTMFHRNSCFEASVMVGVVGEES